MKLVQGLRSRQVTLLLAGKVGKMFDKFDVTSAYEKCPSCGNPMIDVVLMSNPPQHKKKCSSCGREKKTSKDGAWE